MNLQANLRENTPDATVATILVVDDNEANCDLLSRRLKKDNQHVLLAKDGLEALEVLKSEHVDLVLLDIMMPRMDGYEVLERMKADNRLKSIPVIMITALDQIESSVKCIEMGADDYLTKPFNPTLLRARVGASLERKRLNDNERRYREEIEQSNLVLSERIHKQVKVIASAQLAAIFAMSKLAESRDPETGEHLYRMREYCRVLALHLQKLPKYSEIIDREFIDDIYAASPLHDIGKVGVPDAILCKAGKLTEDEWVVMKKHPIVGADTLREVDRQHPGNAFILAGIEIAEGHHEKWDGSGYPYGRQGEEIPLVARILALGDVYDALTSKRVYKDAIPLDESRQNIINDKGLHFDPDIVDAFLACESEFRQIKEEFKDKGP